MRRWRGVAVAAGAFLLAACGGATGAGPSGTASGSAATGTIRFWDTSGATAGAAAIQKLVWQFQEANPGAKVEYTNVPANEAKAKFEKAAAAGEAPDVLRADVAWTPSFAGAGYLEPLDDTPLGLEAKSYLPAALASNEYVGQLWGVPQAVDAPALLCNNDLLTRAGTTVPTSWEAAKAAGPKVTQAGATLLYPPTGGYMTLPYLYSQGGDMLSTTQQKILVNDPPSVAGFQTALDLMASGAAVTPTAVDTYAEQQKLFRDGKVACVVNGPWSVPDALSGTAFQNANNLSVNLIPSGAASGASPIGGQNYVVYAGSHNRPGAYAFISHMNSVASQVQLADGVGMLPTREAAYGQIGNQPGQMTKFVMAFKPVIDASKARPWIPELDALFPAMDEGWIAMRSGRATAKSGADGIAQKWLEILPTDYTD